MASKKKMMPKFTPKPKAAPKGGKMNPFAKGKKPGC
jgi:hypothetical protein